MHATGKQLAVENLLHDTIRDMSKYGNVKTVYKGQTFDSGKEAGYAKLLDTLRRAKNERDRVVSYETQFIYEIKVNGKHIANYFADFLVFYADGHSEVIDVKGVRTDVYKLKKKLVEAIHGIEIKEI